MEHSDYILSKINKAMVSNHPFPHFIIHDFLPQKNIHSPFIIPHKDSPIANEESKLWNSEPIPTAEKLGLVPLQT